MGVIRGKRVLFLCTGNYYRSRYAECLFNAVAEKMGLPWQALSRGLALERGINNVGPMAAVAVKALQAQDIRCLACKRLPTAVAPADLDQADRIIALKEAEHRPLVQERFPAWGERMEYWDVDDAADVLPQIDQEVMNLVARLLGGSASSKQSASPAPAVQERKSQRGAVVRVGRETKGRRGKGVTVIADVPLDEAGLHQLAGTLKEKCGTGGTVKDGRIEIQGDQRDRLSAELERLGYRVKRSGG